MDDSTFVRVHRLKGDASLVFEDSSRHSAGKGAKRFLALLSVVLNVDYHFDVLLLCAILLDRRASVGGEVRYILKGVERFAVVTDENPGIFACDFNLALAFFAI